MTRLPILLAALSLAGPALAHAGGHLHPHAGSPLWAPVLAGLLGIGAAVGVARWRK